MDADDATATATAAEEHLNFLNDRLQAASDEAVEIVHRYASMDPFADDDDDDNPWRHPRRILDELAEVRGRLTECWRRYQEAAVATQNINDGTTKNEEDDKMPEAEFRTMYMDMITDAFGDVLDQMREEEGDKMDINLLVDCLQSGMEFLEDNEINRQSYFDSFREDASEEEGDVPVHELRRRELGYPPLPAETCEGN
jgi:hypothetical protein